MYAFQTGLVNASFDLINQENKPALACLIDCQQITRFEIKVCWIHSAFAFIKLNLIQANIKIKQPIIHSANL